MAALSYLEATPSTSRNILNLHADIDDAKDFSRSAVVGFIGAAFAFLELRHQGFPWFGQFEDAFQLSGNASPDFVFARRNSMAFVEAKGTRRSDAAAEGVVKTAWREQIAYAANALGADEAWVVAACLGQQSAGKLMRAHAKFGLRSRSSSAASDMSLDTHRNGASVVRAVLSSLLNWVNANPRIDTGLRSASTSMGPDAQGVIRRGPTHTFRLANGETLSFSPICTQRVVDDLQVQLDSEVAVLPEADYALQSAIRRSRGVLWWPDGSGLAFEASPRVLEAIFA